MATSLFFPPRVRHHQRAGLVRLRSCSRSRKIRWATGWRRLQTRAGVSGASALAAAQGRQGFSNASSTSLGSVPGGEDWLQGNEKRLTQAGIRRTQRARAYYAMFNVLFLLLAGAGHAVSAAQQHPGADDRRHGGGLADRASCCPSSCCSDWRSAIARKLQEALPDTVDLLGIVLGRAWRSIRR